MFEALQPLPQDPILQLMQTFREDNRPHKVDLGIGVYKDDAGNTPIMAAVHEAERRLLEGETTKSYVGPAGSAGFNSAMAELILGSNSPLLRDGRVSVIQTPGGCGALRMAAEFLRLCKADTKVWVSTPTWANHLPLLGGAGLTIREYPYLNPETLQVDFGAMLETLEQADAGDVVLLHGCCHNPSGLDPSEDEWRAIADVIVDRGLVPFVDMAYQGFATGLDEDAFIVRHLADRVPTMIVSTSCSKNFGLYRDRVGTVSVLAPDSSTRDIVASQLANIVRTLYSVPPDHGAAVVAEILADKALTTQWHGELTAMRERLIAMRTLLNDALKAKAPGHDFSHLVRANGMFCFLGISEAQVNRLKKDYGVYMVGSSRINVAGITPANVEYLAESIAAVL